MRLDKFICKSTTLNTLQATTVIESGLVVVNGEIVSRLNTQVHENNTILLHGKPLTARPFRHLMLHKPVDSVCSNIDEAYPSIFNALGIENSDELHVTGRLDADTTGLVLATDDGRWSFNIIRPNQSCPKVYRVQLRDPVTSSTIKIFESGLLLQGERKKTLPATLEVVSPHEVLLTITEGRYHQVKRMFAAVGNRVVSLHREKIGEVALDVPAGHWRELTPLEISHWK